MNPAYSVILFTTASGAGYGLLFWLGLWVSGKAFALQAGSTGLLVCLVTALVLITVGLLASTAHLGHPERAWRALSQWRSSWLSREGVLALLSYLPSMGLGVALFLPRPEWIPLLGLACAVMSLLTVFSTAMIYASLKTIPRWSNPWVPAVYLSFSLATGGLIFHAIAIGQSPGTLISHLTAGLLLAAWLLKLLYWRSSDRADARATSGSATGLSDYGEVRLFAAPNTEANFIQKEMGYRIARKHASKLRRLALMGALAALSLLLATPSFSGWMAQAWALLAAGVALAAVAIERWLFFAEARHVVNLYYGDRAV